MLSLLAGRLFVVGRWAGCARHNFVGFKFKGFWTKTTRPLKFNTELAGGKLQTLVIFRRGIVKPDIPSKLHIAV